MKRNAITVFLFIVLVLSVNCGRRDYAKQLSNGYMLVKNNSFEVIIWSPSTPYGRSMMVPPSIVKFATVNKWVVGLTESNDFVRNVYGNMKPAVLKDGYFILNTVTGEVNLGLSEHEFDVEIKNLKIDFDYKFVIP